LIADWCYVFLEFSDALTPVSADFIENSFEEAVYQIRRINHHPSLALWVGNNEIEYGLLVITVDFPEYLEPAREQYEYMYLDVLLRAVYDNTRSISYSPSSVTHGYTSLNHSAPRPMVERYLNSSSPDAIYGNTDYYNYDAFQAFNLSSYPIGRFSIEFGFMSQPSLQSWQQVLPDDAFHFNSSIIVSRNHHYPVATSSILAGPPKDLTNQSLAGMGQMTIPAELYYPTPLKADPIANFSAQCHTTQIFQADMYKSEISFYRLGSGLPQRTMGSMYWMLNDIWQAPSYGSLEYDGRWRVTHYAVKDIYQPVIIAPFFNYTTGDLQVYAISDLWSTVTGTAKLAWFDWAGKAYTVSSSLGGSVQVSVGAINATKVFELNTKSLPFALDNAVAVLTVEVQGTPFNSADGKVQTYTHTNWFSPVPLSQAKLVDPELSLSYNKATKKFSVESRAIAVHTWFDHPAGVIGNFEDNGFIILPGQKRELSFTTKEDTTAGKWVKDVTVESIWNNTLA
jgi:beta-mannosidase